MFVNKEWKKNVENLLFEMAQKIMQLEEILDGHTSAKEPEDK